MQQVGWVGSNSKSRNVQESRIYINTAFILHGAMALIPWLHVMFREKIILLRAPRGPPIFIANMCPNLSPNSKTQEPVDDSQISPVGAQCAHTVKITGDPVQWSGRTAEILMNSPTGQGPGRV